MAVLRASQHGVGLRVQYDYRFPKDAKGNPLPLVTLVRGASVTGSPEACADVAERIGALMFPPETREVEGWLAELSVIVAKRTEDDFTEELRLEAYASRLRRYPLDVVRHVLLERTWKFWPAWAELEEACEAATAPRRAMVMALEAQSRQFAPAPARSEATRERITPERAAEIMREVFGERQQ